MQILKDILVPVIAFDQHSNTQVDTLIKTHPKEN